MSNKIYNFTNNFDLRTTFVKNAIQIAFSFVIKQRSSLLFFPGSLIFVESWRFLTPCRGNDAQGDENWPDLPQEFLIQFLSSFSYADDATWKFSCEVKSSGNHLCSFEKGKDELALRYQIWRRSFFTQRQQVRNFVCVRVPDYSSVSAKLGSRP